VARFAPGTARQLRDGSRVSRGPARPPALTLRGPGGAAAPGSGAV